MIILNSLAILEQLSKIEDLIKRIENYIEDQGLEIDKNLLLSSIRENRKDYKSSRFQKEN